MTHVHGCGRRSQAARNMPSPGDVRREGDSLSVSLVDQLKVDEGIANEDVAQQAVVLVRFGNVFDQQDGLPVDQLGVFRSSFFIKGGVRARECPYRCSAPYRCRRPGRPGSCRHRRQRRRWRSHTGLVCQMQSMEEGGRVGVLAGVGAAVGLGIAQAASTENRGRRVVMRSFTG